MAEQQDNYTKNRAAAYRVLFVEAGVTVLLALVLSAAWNLTAGKSAALGGLIMVAPNALFVSYALRRPAPGSATSALRGLYVGETVKVLLTILLFGACFEFAEPLNAGVLLVTYVVLLVINLAGNARAFR